MTELAFIGGRRRRSRSQATTALVDPASGRPWREVSACSRADLDDAVEAAEVAFTRQGWGRSSSARRSEVLLALAGRIELHREELAELESRNVGKPLREAREEVALAARCFRFYAGAADKAGGSTVPVAAAGLNLTLREPVGVCGLIVPWNFPLVISAWKVAPALAMANTVVVKPATQTPLTVLRLAELASESGLPDGAFNVVPGPGDEVGDALVRHRSVRKISFTGSTEVGISVMKLAAEDLKRVTLELGGKSANVVFADADIDRAADAAVWSVLGNAGQDCCARSRLFVQRPLYESFVQRVAERFRAVILGAPLDESTQMGPLISKSHRRRVMEYVESGKRQGARLLCGGRIPETAELTDGAYLEPALFVDAGAETRIMREEIFGPVLAAAPFDSEEQAVALANDTTYGLSGSVWTRDLGQALRVAGRIRTGVLSINSATSVHLEAPFGGVRHSGIGRELGLAALDTYSELKTVYIDPR